MLFFSWWAKQFGDLSSYGWLLSNDYFSVDGLPLLLAVNTIAPYILTSLINQPKRLVYLSFGIIYRATLH
jgi:hypothetical protein